MSSLFHAESRSQCQARWHSLVGLGPLAGQVCFCLPWTSWVGFLSLINIVYSDSPPSFPLEYPLQPLTCDAPWPCLVRSFLSKDFFRTGRPGAFHIKRENSWLGTKVKDGLKRHCPVILFKSYMARNRRQLFLVIETRSKDLEVFGKEGLAFGHENYKSQSTKKNSVLDESLIIWPRIPLENLSPFRVKGKRKARELCVCPWQLPSHPRVRDKTLSKAAHFLLPTTVGDAGSCMSPHCLQLMMMASPTGRWALSSARHSILYTVSHYSS